MKKQIFILPLIIILGIIVYSCNKEIIQNNKPTHTTALRTSPHHTITVDYAAALVAAFHTAYSYDVNGYISKSDIETFRNTSGGDEQVICFYLGYHNVVSIVAILQQNDFVEDSSTPNVLENESEMNLVYAYKNLYGTENIASSFFKDEIFSLVDNTAGTSIQYFLGYENGKTVLILGARDSNGNWIYRETSLT